MRANIGKFNNDADERNDASDQEDRGVLDFEGNLTYNASWRKLSACRCATVLNFKNCVILLPPSTEKRPGGDGCAGDILLRGILRFSLAVAISALEPAQGDLFAGTGTLSPGTSFAKISVENGLPSSSVWAILHDKSGFLWFGTENGLCRYDGYEIVVFRNDPADSSSLSDNFISSLSEDSAGILWVGTFSRGLNRFDLRTGRFRRFLHIDGDGKSLSDNTIMALYRDRRGRLWIGTRQGLNRLDSLGAPFVVYRAGTNQQSSLSHQLVLGIGEDRKGNIWVTTARGLNRLDPATSRIDQFLSRAIPHEAILDNFTQGVLESRSGTIWVATRGGLRALIPQDPSGGGTPEFTVREYHHKPDDPVSLVHNFTRVLLEDQSGRIWIGTSGGGLDVLDPVTGRFCHYQNEPGNPGSLPSNQVLALMLDSTNATADRAGGTIWVGTTGGGVSRVKFDPGLFALYRHDPNDPGSLPDGVVHSLCSDKNGFLWAGVSDCGLSRFDPRLRTNRQYVHSPPDRWSLSNNWVESILEDSRGNLWVATRGGLDLFDRANNRFRHFRHDPSDSTSLSSNDTGPLYEDCDGDLWVGINYGGLNCMDVRTGGCIRIGAGLQEGQGLPFAGVTALAGDREGRIWIGTYDRGLFCYNKRSRTFIRYLPDPSQPESICSEKIWTLHADSTGTLWIGTPSGLDRFDPCTGVFNHYFNDRNPIPDFIRCILTAGDGSLWLTSLNRGLIRFNPRTGSHIIFDRTDGLDIPFLDGVVRADGKGNVYVGGYNGIAAMCARPTPAPTLPPNVVITSVRMGEEHCAPPVSLPFLDKIHIPRRLNSVSFTYAALSFSTPSRNLYGYQMEGLDKHWTEAGSRTYASYTNLESGEYTFRVRASSSNGAWNLAGTSIRVRIDPPYWRTWWFRSLVLVAFALVLFVLHRFRAAHLLAIERVRVRIASDLHDDIGAELTKIAIRSEIIQNTPDTARIQILSRQIGVATRGIITTLGDVIWSIDARNDTLGNLLDRMRELVAEAFLIHHVEVRFETHGIDQAKKMSVDVRQNIYLIFKEAMNNIVRHSSASHVQVSITNTGGKFSMLIMDDGRGIPQNGHLTGQGLRNMKLRAERIGAQLRVLSPPGVQIHVTMKKL